MKKLFYALLSLALTACGGSIENAPANQLASSDFESLAGWTNGIPLGPSLTKEKAHSGQYAVSVSPAIDYSLGFNDQLGRISPARVAKLRVHGWVFLPNDKATVVLVTEVTNAGQVLLWDGLDLLKEAREKSSFNKWFEIDHTVALPATVAYTSNLKVYMWRSGSSQPAYLDDLQIFKAD